MTKLIALSALFVLALDHGHCEDLAKVAAFEVASITPCKPGTPEPPGEHMGMVQFTSPGGRFRAEATTLKFLLEWAYSIQPSQHSAGPAWMANERYDIVAKAAGNATDEEMKLMVRTLLDERFHLTHHMESRSMSVFVLSPGKTAAKLSPPKDGEVHGIRVEPQKDGDQKIASWHVVATRFSLAQLTDTFARHLDHPILNRTGLDGEYDFTLDLTPDENSPNPLDPTLVMHALRDQLGLGLKVQDLSVDYFVVDGAERVSAGN